MRIVASRVGAVLGVLTLSIAAACGGGGSQPTGTSTATPTAQASGPERYLQYGADGLAQVTSGGQRVLATGPVRWAASDGSGGVLFARWDPQRFGPTWWLAGGSTVPRVVLDTDEVVVPVVERGRPAVAMAGLGSGCGPGDGRVDLVRRDLATGAETTLSCDLARADEGSGVDSYGGGRYVGERWRAVGGWQTDLAFVFWDRSGRVADEPANPVSDGCGGLGPGAACRLSGRLSPDGGTLAATVARPGEAEARLLVVELGSGREVLGLEVRWGVTVTGFDGRWVVLGPDPAVHAEVSEGDEGVAVRELQRRLNAAGAAVVVDGVFGPKTAAAFDLFQRLVFGSASGRCDEATWAALGVPTTLVEVQTGSLVQLPGLVALEARLR